MSADGRTWEISLRTAGSKATPVFCVNLPAPLSRALAQDGYSYVELSVTGDGILLRPRKGKRATSKSGEVVSIPEWDPA